MVTKINVKKHFNSEDEYSMGKFVTDVFNNTDFAKFVTNDNDKIYINDDKSSIKLENNGTVEYTNNAKVGEDDSSVSKNLNIALDFIKNMKVFENFFLLSAIENDGLYTFDFCVAMDGIVASFSQPVIGENRYPIMQVKVQNGEVRYFKGKLVDIEITNQKAYVSKITHNILDNLLKKAENGSKVNISELELIYDITREGSYYPSWITVYSLNKEENGVSVISVTNK